MKRIVTYRSPGYNYNFDRKTGLFARWGVDEKDDPAFAPQSEILDLEVSDICSQGCLQCYKSNTTKGINMSFDDFKIIIDKMPFLLQVAFGIGDIDANPDLPKMLSYCRMKGIIPNITINGYRMNDGYTRLLAGLCGAVSVSLYDKDVCYNTLDALGMAGLKQRNIHVLVSKETLDICHRVLVDFNHDPRLKGLNAVVFLLLKPKGDRNTYTAVSGEEYSDLIDQALKKKVRFGADSCSAPKMMDSLEHTPDYETYKTYVEPCESARFSAYINCKGSFFPCSFADGEPGWEEGLDVLGCNDFIKDIWNHHRTLDFRTKNMDNTDRHGCNNCVLFNL